MKNTILMNAQEVAEALGVSKASAYKMIHVWNERLHALETSSNISSASLQAAEYVQYLRWDGLMINILFGW